MIWPASYAEGNSRRVTLLRKQRDGLTAHEGMELEALESMVEAWVESRYPTPRFDDTPIVRGIAAVYGERYIRSEFTIDET